MITTKRSLEQTIVKNDSWRLDPKVSREVEIIRQIKKMKDFIWVATQYAQKTAKADTVQDEEHLQIIEELLNMKDAEFTDDECDSSVELEKFNFKLNN